MFLPITFKNGNIQSAQLAFRFILKTHVILHVINDDAPMSPTACVHFFKRSDAD